MFKKKETEKFEKVPQVEIDDRLYHDSAEVGFGITKEEMSETVNGNKVTTRIYKLKKYVMVRGKVASESVLRSEEGLAGKVTIKNQLELEVKKELKRMG